MEGEGEEVPSKPPDFCRIQIKCHFLSLYRRRTGLGRKIPCSFLDMLPSKYPWAARWRYPDLELRRKIKARTRSGVRGRCLHEDEDRKLSVRVELAKGK